MGKKLPGNSFSSFTVTPSPSPRAPVSTGGEAVRVFPRSSHDCAKLSIVNERLCLCVNDEGEREKERGKRM